MHWTEQMMAAREQRSKMTCSERVEALLAGEGLIYPDAKQIRREVERLGYLLPVDDPGRRYLAAMNCPSAGSHLSPAQRDAFAASWGRVRREAHATLRMPDEALMAEIRSAANLAYSLVEWREAMAARGAA